MERYFHNTPENLGAFWNAFARHYFNVKDEKGLRQINELVEPFAALTCIHFSNRNPYMSAETRSCINTLLIDKLA